MRLLPLLPALACLMGAAGVAAAAAAGHSGGGEARWAAAAQMLLVHAAASLALFAVASREAGFPRLLAGATIGLQGGAILFALDMAARSLAGHALFAMAAPLGGTLVIAGWLLAAAWFLLSLSGL